MRQGMQTRSMPAEFRAEETDGRRVIEALCERARRLGWREVLVGEIYDWNVASQRCFSAAGFKPYERTDRGARWRRRL